MFDIGFSELFVIAIVALLVLGPERLPKAARFVGLWVRRARAQWYSVKSELENELADDETRRNLLQARDQLQDEMRQLRDGMQHGAQALRDGFDAAPTAPEPSASPMTAGGEPPAAADAAMADEEAADPSAAMPVDPPTDTPHDRR